MRRFHSVCHMLMRMRWKCYRTACEDNHLMSPVVVAVGYPDESGKSSCQRCSHVGAEGQECGPGCWGHRASEPGYCCRHPVRPVHFPASGMCQGTRANDLNKSNPKRAEQSSALPLASSHGSWGTHCTPWLISVEQKWILGMLRKCLEMMHWWKKYLNNLKFCS